MRKATVLLMLLLLLATVANVPTMAKEQLSVWVTWAPAGEAVKEFNKLQDDIEVSVQLINVGNSDPNGKFTTAVAGGVPPDLVLTWDDDLINFAVNGLIQPIDDYMALAKVDPKNYLQPAWEQTHYQGKAYGVPFCWDVDDLLFYNKRMLEESGYSASSVPEYLDELTAMQKRLTRQDGDGKYTRTGVRMFQEGWGYTPLTITKSFRGQIWDPVAQRPDFTNPRNLDAWNWIEGYWQQFGAAEKGTKTFANLGAAFYIGGDWNLSAFTKTIPLEDIGFARMPYPREGISFTPGSGWAWMLPTGAKNRPATYKLLQWLTQPDTNLKIIAGTGLVPADIRALRSKELQESSKGIFARISMMEGNYIWQNPNPLMAKNAGILLNQVKLPIQAGTMPPKTALENAQKAAEVMFADFFAKFKK